MSSNRHSFLTTKEVSKAASALSSGGPSWGRWLLLVVGVAILMGLMWWKDVKSASLEEDFLQACGHAHSVRVCQQTLHRHGGLCMSRASSSRNASTTPPNEDKYMACMMAKARELR